MLLSFSPRMDFMNEPQTVAATAELAEYMGILTFLNGR